MRVSRRPVARACGSIVLALALLAPSVVAAPLDQTVPAGDAAGREWLTYGGNLFNQRYSSLNQINTSNVANLKGAWTYHTGASSQATSFESSPVVVDGVMYLTGPQSQVYALDAKTGQEMWKYIPDITGIEVHRASIVDGKEYCHAAVTCDIELPFGGIWMPVKFTHASRFDCDQSGGNVLRSREVAGVNYPYFASLA